jgi:hypothetical protein
LRAGTNFYSPWFRAHMLSCPAPFAWQIRKVRHDHTGEQFVLLFLERASRRLGSPWSGEGRELVETELRLRAGDRGIPAPAIDEALAHARGWFLRHE